MLLSGWRREERLPPSDALAAAIRALAGSIRAGSPPAVALAAWKDVVPEPLVERVAMVGRRVALGETPAAAAAELDPALARSFALHRTAGGSLPSLLERVADGIERHAAAAGSARAATSGARLSARLVAGLPLAFAPLTSGGTPFRSGLAGFVLVVTGIALAAAGLWWIGRLVPAPPRADDGAAALADDLAAALGGGIGLLQALEAAAEHPPAGLEEELGRASRRVRLGDHWVTALSREGGATARVAAVIARSRSWGVPAAAPLREWAAARRAEVRTETQRALRRAPVLMVVPLTVCVLPSFALLAFGPFVLGAFAAR